MGWRDKKRLAALSLPVALLGQCGPGGCVPVPPPTPTGYVRELAVLCMQEDPDGWTDVTFIATRMAVDATMNDSVENLRFRWRLIPSRPLESAEDARIPWSRTYDMEEHLGEWIEPGTSYDYQLEVFRAAPGWEDAYGEPIGEAWYLQVEYAFARQDPDPDDVMRVKYARPGSVLRSDEVLAGVEIAPDSGCNSVGDIGFA